MFTGAATGRIWDLATSQGIEEEALETCVLLTDDQWIQERWQLEAGTVAAQERVSA